MTSTAAVTGVILLLLSVEGVQHQNFWELECSQSSVCLFKGSTVEVDCTIEFPPGLIIKDEQVFWLTQEQNREPVDILGDPRYKGRVAVSSGPGRHTLIITDLRESDSAEYNFKIRTKYTGGMYGRGTRFVIHVTGVQVQMNKASSPDRPYLSCETSCSLPGTPSFIWYKTGEEDRTGTSKFYDLESLRYGTNFSCAVEGHEDFPSPPVWVQRQNFWELECSQSSVCLFKGSTVEVDCTIEFPPGLTIKDERVFWLTTEQNREPVDILRDPRYKGRVAVSSGPGRHTLIITDLRESDSAEYNFKIRTKYTGGMYGHGTRFVIHVTGVQVQLNKASSPDRPYLSCETSCSLPGTPSFIWYKNGEEDQTGTSKFYDLENFRNGTGFSCAVEGHEDFPSPPVCVSGSSCNRVTYTDRTICAPKGSSLEISCYYNSYEEITSKFWFSPGLHHQWQNPSLPEDLSKDSQYADRVQVLETERERSSLRIRDLRESDSADYRFKFKTQSFEWGGSLPATTVSVTGALQVQVRRISSNQSSTYADLRCLSSCSPAGSFSYTWIRNGETDIRGTETFIYEGWFSLEEEISCALKGHEQFLSPPVYAPRFPSVVSSSFGEILENSSVTLTCSSDANPEANYTWYKKNGDPDFQPLSTEAELVFSAIQSADSGEYYCEAENHLGKRTSRLFMVNVKYKSTLILNVVRLALMVVILVLVLLLHLWIRTKTAASSIPESNEPEETVELESHPDDNNPSALRGVPAVQTPDTEEEETPV